MKLKKQRIILLIIAVGLFLTTIILTSDFVKEKLDTRIILPVVMITFLLVICRILFLAKQKFWMSIILRMIVYYIPLSFWQSRENLSEVLQWTFYGFSIFVVEYAVLLFKLYYKKKNGESN
jgi:hypothetical protein